MADGNDISKIYVIATDTVLRAIKTLEGRPIHEHFPGYLAVLRAKRARSHGSVQSSDIRDFHERYLRVRGAPDSDPYVHPFRSRGRGIRQLNKNVAGSYGASSVRAKGKFGQVVDISGERQSATYDLQPDHATRALKIFLGNKRIPTTSLAAFLYRDYGFELDMPGMAAVTELFRDEFGLRESIAEEEAVFAVLFEDDISSFYNSDLQILLPEISE